MRGVSFKDEHDVSPKLRQAIPPASMLVSLEIPKMTEKRATQLAAAFEDIARLPDVPEHQLITAGLPADTAAAFLRWNGDPAHQALFKRSMPKSGTSFASWLVQPAKQSNHFRLMARQLC